jgi:hypothetical protein
LPGGNRILHCGKSTEAIMQEVPSCVERKIAPMPHRFAPAGAESTPVGGASAGRQPLPAFPRAASRTIRFWTFPCGGSSRKVKSLARQPARLVTFPLPSTIIGRVVLVVPPCWPLRALPPTLTKPLFSAPCRLSCRKRLAGSIRKPHTVLGCRIEQYPAFEGR